MVNVWHSKVKVFLQLFYCKSNKEHFHAALVVVKSEDTALLTCWKALGL